MPWTLLVVILLASPPPVSPSTPSTGAAVVKPNPDDKAQISQAYRDMYRAMLERRTDELAPLLSDQYSLTHITGLRQPKREWLSAIDSGQMRYHSAKEKSVTVEVTGDTAVLVGRSVVDATIYGSRGAWNLQLTTNYARKDGKWIAMSTVATTY
jgi:ketosteroid isomerase-like protein